MAECLTPALPEDQFVMVLQSIEQRERISLCSLVNSAWNKAVKRSVSSLECELYTTAQYQSLSSWLTTNSSVSSINSMTVGSNLCYRELCITDIPYLQLPYFALSNLKTLRLQCCSMLPASMTAIGTSSVEVQAASLESLAALTALTQLQLEKCYVRLYELRSCTQLRHLDLQLIPFLDGRIPAADGSMQAVETELAAALPQLQHLTHLSVGMCLQRERTIVLDFGPVSKACSNLMQLQVLQIGQYVAVPERSFAHLPVSLHMLKMYSYSIITVAAAPHLEQLTNLQQLQLVDMYIPQPEVVLSCPQLTRLDVVDLFRLDEPNYGLSEDTAEDIELKLLAVLLELKQLKHLSLSGSLICNLPVESYAAITASSQLTYLDLTSCNIKPSAAWQIFVQGRCSSLVKIQAALPLLESPGSYRLLVSCCPALQSLHVDNMCGFSEDGKTDEEVSYTQVPCVYLSRRCSNI